MKDGKNSTSQPIKIKLRSYLESRQSPEHWINQIYTVSDEQIGNDTIIFRNDHTIDLKNLFSGKWKSRQGTWQVSEKTLAITDDWINWRGNGFSFPLHNNKPEAYTIYRDIGFGVKFKKWLFKSETVGTVSRKRYPRFSKINNLPAGFKVINIHHAASRLSGLTALPCFLG